ncbi:PAS domain-containing sensor histidine kinase [Algibacter sp. L4_22]|uniref:PAS domain-containing sensor histidine kinase n=1 Tax=Algibacter sp. L4_22 TaxID=2942477 RepID=UPI00201B7EC6|nr:PAS domain-containing sensor histidine kinase [Algibacter sp. L4_22]MCL5127742.1 PAS domain-containing sensor histidine kinase [Algibacter sp. L4_22]
MKFNIDYKELYNTSPSGYFCTLPDGTIIDANQRFLELTNYKREEVIEKKQFMDFLSVGSKIYYETVYSQTLKLSGTLEEINFDFKKKDGTKFPVLINSVEVKDKAGHHLYTQSAIFNISHRKKYEQELLIAKRKANNLSDELIQTNEELRRSSDLISQQKLQLEKFNHHLENKNSQLSSFTHIAAHNLRAPVSNLVSLQDFYKESTEEEDRTMLFSKIEIVIGHLNETLNELIESVKIQGNTNIVHDPITFDNVFDKTLEILEGQTLDSKAVVTSNFSKVTKIEYPKLYMESIMLNLMSNSIRYRSPNRIPNIHFSSEINKNEVVLLATDNGLGIDLKKHGHKLFGLSNTFHRHPDSKGVGLFMIKTQIEAIGGSITAESDVDKGTTFKIILKKNI